MSHAKIRRERLHVGAAVNVFAAALALQAVHQIEHLAQLVQAKILLIKPAHGLFGSIFDNEWVHVVYNGGLFVLLVLTTVTLVRERVARRPIGWLFLGGALAVQSYHVVEHAVKLAQHLTTGVDPAPGVLGQILDLVWLHFTFNLIVLLLMVAGFLGLGLHHELAPLRATVSHTAGRAARRPRKVATAGAVALALVAAGVVVGGPFQADGNLVCVDVASARGIEFRGVIGDSVVAGDEMSTAMQQNMGNGAAVGDYDGDGDLDVYLLGQSGHPNRLFRNEHGVSSGFVDVTEAAHVGDRGMGRAAQFVDLDNDGQLDLVLANDFVTGTNMSPSRIYRNRGDGTFEDVTDGSGFDPVGYLVGGLAIADYDRDGMLDIYVSFWTMDMGRGQSSHIGWNRLYRNQGGLQFRDVTEQSGLGRFGRDSFTPVFTDFNGDGWPDIYLAVDHTEDVFYQNTAGTFSDVSSDVGVSHTGNDMGVAVADPGGTGLLSLYVTNITDPEDSLGTPPGGNTLLETRLSPGGGLRFENRAEERGVRTTGWGWGTAFVDMDLDGILDLYAAQGMDRVTLEASRSLYDDQSYLYLGRPDGGYRQYTGSCEVPGDQRALVVFDYDRNGRPDILMTQVVHPPLLLENRSSPDRHSLTVVPVPRPGGTAVGARVTVRAAGQSQSRPIIAGTSYLSGLPFEAYFGLGDIARVDDVIIEWPDGQLTTIRNVNADQTFWLHADGSVSRRIWQ